MEFQDISLRNDGAVGVLSFNRPSRGNAVHPDMLQEVCTAIDILVVDPTIKAIVLRAEGKNFSAGADLSWLDRLTSTPALQIQNDIYSRFQGAARRLYRCPKPTVAAVQGAAVTVGCELALTCDFRLVSESGFFQESWIKLGLMPPLGGLFLLPRMVGLGRASQMCLRGEAISAERAVDIGLAMEVVPQANLDVRALDLARELAALAPTAYATVKQALQRGLESSMDAEWATNVSKQALLIGSDDFKEGLGAVRERRTAVFTGR